MTAYTRSEIDYLTENCKTLSVATMAEALGRKPKSVYNKLYAFGLNQKPIQHRKYSDEYVAEIVQDDITMKRQEIAEKRGLSVRQVSHLLSRGGVYGPDYKRKARSEKWTRSDDKLLEREYPHRSAVAIAHDLGKKEHAVCTRAWLLGLTNTGKSRGQRRYSPEFVEKIAEQYVQQSAIEIAKQHGLNRDQVNYILQRAGIIGNFYG